MNVDVVTPSKLILREEVDEVYAPGILGEFGILSMHTPFLSLLGIGSLTLKKGRETKKFVINGGYVEVSQDKIIILTETCEEAKGIDIKRAKVALDESQKAILELDASSPDYKEHWDRVRRASARIDVAESADL